MSCLSPKRFRMHLVATFGLAWLGLGSGCCFMGSCPPGGYAHLPGGMVEAGCDSCGGDCGGSCGGACEGGDCGCGEMYPGSCGTCASGSCGGLSALFLPLMCTKLGCGSGCGGVYWNEWVCDPPDCCDPCDSGCWVGPRCGGSPCGSGLFTGGPFAVVGGVVRGSVGVVRGALGTALYGYPGRGCSSCSSCTEEVFDGGGCDSCGTVGCDGGCAQMEPTMTSDAIAQRPPHRLVTKRLRR